MKDTVKSILNMALAIIVAIVVPLGTIYLGGSFVKLNWNWLPMCTNEERLAIIIVTGCLYCFVAWCIVTYSKDDRREK